MLCLVVILYAPPVAAIQSNVDFLAKDHEVEAGPFNWVKSLFGGGSAPASKSRPLVKNAEIEIYYETLCPYCIDLLNSSVRELFADEELKQRVSLKMYPFGNTLVLWNVSEGYRFWHDDAVFPIFACQHSDQECLGNMIQACALDELGSVDKFVPFALCMASYGGNTGVELSSYACGQELGVDMDTIKKCAFGRTGTQIMSDLGKKTMDPSLQQDHVPWVMINGVHDGPSEEGKLLKSVCTVLKEPKPALCEKKFPTHHAAGCGGGGHC